MLSHQAQANDNRSKIVVKTCKIIQLFSENLKNSFDRIASNIFPTYLEKVSSGITVFAFFCPNHQVISSSIAQTCLTMTKNIVMKTNITVITTSIDNRRYAFPSLPFRPGTASFPPDHGKEGSRGRKGRRPRRVSQASGSHVRKVRKCIPPDWFH